MGEPSNQKQTALTQRSFTKAAVMITLTVVGCSVYANLSYLVTKGTDYRFIPPFRSGENHNMNDHLGAEYHNIAKAMLEGRGYSDPFGASTGSTAWMPPVLPGILAALRWVCDEDAEAVTGWAVMLQNVSLFVTGLLILALFQQNSLRLWLAAIVYVLALLYHFRMSFQFTHDHGIVLVAFDGLLAGLLWARPFDSSWWVTAAWGAFGGLCALISPVVGFAWGMLSFFRGRGQGCRLALALLIASITITPWVVRNYFVFGRFIPVKSNLAFELYQSQCLQEGGVLRFSSFLMHPYNRSSAEHQEYLELGETAYLSRKKDQFVDAFQASPLDWAQRVANRFLAATLVYMPFDPAQEERRPLTLWIDRVVHPLPFLSLLVLLITARRWGLSSTQWIVIGAYTVYLLPYVLVSYYERYTFSLMGVQVALVLWAAGRLQRLGGTYARLESIAHTSPVGVHAD